MTSWESVSRAVVSALQADSVLKAYAKIVFVESVQSYLENSTAQTVNDGYVVLVAPPEGDTERTESLIGGIKRKYYLIALAIVVKNEATGKTRLYGERGKGIFEVKDDVERILEHSNLSGVADNKAGTNFESAWTKVPLENRSTSIYTNVFTAVKTE